MERLGWRWSRWWWWWRWSPPLPDPTLLILLLILLKASLASRSPAAEVVVMYEGCGKAIEVGAALSSSTTHLLPLPCGGGELQELSSSSFSSLPPSPPVVVIASCPVIARVTTSLGHNNTVLGGPPSIILPVPVAHSPSCLAHRKATGAAVVPVTGPVERALNLLLSWMAYHSWKTLNVLYDRSLDPSTFAFFLKGLLAGTADLGARVSFREMPAGASGQEVVAVMGTVVEAWRNNGANHVTVITAEETLVHLLHVIPDFKVEDGESDCDWLVFAKAVTDVPLEYTPTNGHNVYFADASLHTTLKERSQAAVRIAQMTSDTCHAHQPAGVAVFVRRPDYEKVLTPEVTLGRPYPWLIPTFTWTPPPAPAHPSWPHGKMRALPSYRQYLLHGAHLVVATIRGLPFIEPLPDPDKNKTSEEYQQRLPHVNCTQPPGFSGFLVDMLEVIAKEMNFTYELYEVCDKAYGSEVDGRWTGVMGEVVEGRAHLGLANLGANYGRSHAVAFPRISTSYGGAGIILRRPESTATDRLTVYMLPFSSEVWAFLLASIPLAALTMHFATMPRQVLHRRLLRVFSQFGGGGQRLSASPSPSPLPDNPIKVFVTSASEAATTRLWTMADSWTTTLSMKGKEAEEEEKRRKNEEDLPRSFLDGVWFASTVLMQQGQDVVPSSGVARSVFGVVWVSAVILYAAYTSNLVSHFTVTKLSLPVNNLEELVASSYKFGTRTGSVYIDNMKMSDTGVYQAASRKLQSFGNSVLMSTYEDAIQRTLQGSYAFIGDYVVLDYYQRKDCNLVLLKQRLFPTMSSIALPQGSPLLPAFNHYLSLMSESGITEKLRQKWWSAQPCPSAATLTAYHSIQMMEVFSALVVMGAGVALALMVCCLECARPPRLP
ncbi:uncharacterized protein LOC126981542 isoform X2 [Eriocheir sinensis]|uniref:uncharacterized protein LOC126981542 isoform X2 n=1 Tax=Eriocheir sinensis TaxID=95602 RepID=UPI0021C90C8D|nr:uncharacterized protein LOC126981542 isoform X2 [Eriocheir sinensis]